MQETQQQREAKAEAWKRSAAGLLAAKRDKEDREMRRNLWIAVVLFIGGGIIAGGCLVRTAAEVDSLNTPSSSSGPPDIWATDGTEEQEDAGAVPVLARPMPAKPFEGQKRPPCGSEQVAISGGCWEVLKRKPQSGSCGPGAFEYLGECHIPVKQAKRPPTSVEP